MIAVANITISSSGGPNSKCGETGSGGTSAQGRRRNAWCSATVPDRAWGCTVPLGKIDLETFFTDAVMRSAVGRAIPDGSVVHFEIAGDGGGVWTLKRIGTRVDLIRDFRGHADSWLKCSAEDFCGLLDGQLDPREGYMKGRLRVTGDVGIVLDLQRAVRTS